MTQQESSSVVLAQPKPCGDCSLCCKVFKVPELDKPKGVWCRHFVKGTGCGVHATRPPVCRNYQCVWTLAAPLDEQWRPDRAGFVINPLPVATEMELVADPGRPDDWRREPYYSQIKRWANRDAGPLTRVLVFIQERVIVVFPETEIDLGPSTGLPNIDSGYEWRDGRLRPYARYAKADDPPRGVTA